MLRKHAGYGALLGDIVGSIYEFNPLKQLVFELCQDKMHVTDDSIMTLAVMDKLMYDYPPYNIEFKWWGNRYPNAGYGGHFAKWLVRKDMTPNSSFGNGAAMRVSPVGYAFNRQEEVLLEAANSALASHAHWEAVKGAMCIADCILMCREGKTKEYIREFVRKGYYQYNFEGKIPRFEKFKVSCQDTVPVAIACFLQTTTVEGAIRFAVNLGGDCDTIGSMAAELQVAFNGTLDNDKQYNFVRSKLDRVQLAVLEQFNEWLEEKNHPLPCIC